MRSEALLSAVWESVSFLGVQVFPETKATFHKGTELVFSELFHELARCLEIGSKPSMNHLPGTHNRAKVWYFLLFGVP